MTRDGIKIYGGLTEEVDYTQFETQKGTLAITNINVLSSEGDRMIANQTVILDNGVIVSIDSLAKIPEKASVIDGAGKYLIPGLIDAHVHLFQSPNDLLLYIANGVTEVRELIGEKHHLEWRDEIENGRIGPKMFVASPRLGSFETLDGWFMSWSQGYMNIQGEEDAVKKVTNLHEAGYDGIKVYSQLTKESYLAINETAKSLGMPVMGHIPWKLELSDVFENGQSDIAHLEEIMNALQREFNPDHNSWFGSFYGKEEEFMAFVNERSKSFADQLIANNISVTSTLWLTESFVKQKFELEELLKQVELEYENPGISEWVSYIPQGLGWLPDVNRYKMAENLTAEKLASHKKYWTTYGKACKLIAKNFADQGVMIMAGTDTNLPPAVPGFSLHDELISLSEAGLTPAQVLKTATSVPAEWLKSKSGKIEAGYDANLVLLDRNPLENISNTKSINAVISKGRLYDKNLLDQILDAVKSANNDSRNKSISEYL